MNFIYTVRRAWDVLNHPTVATYARQNEFCLVILQKKIKTAEIIWKKFLFDKKTLTIDALKFTSFLSALKFMSFLSL